MQRLKHYIQEVMAGEEKDRFPSPRSALFILSRVYGGLARIKEHACRLGIVRPRTLPRPVISIGNLTVGGTGKTPMAIYLASLLHRMGHGSVVISRGYGGKAVKSGGIAGNGQNVLMSPDEAGDEPCMMAQKLVHSYTPVLVGHDRYKSGLTAIREFDPDVIILDDGFQHMKLHRDVDLVLLDFHRPFGNGHLLPRGPLREPARALERADAFVLTRSDRPPDAVTRQSLEHLDALAGEKPVFRATHRPYVSEFSHSRFLDAGTPESVPLDGLKGFAFSGIAGNAGFRAAIKTLGCELAGYMDFEDHHPYSGKDIHTICRRAEQTGAGAIITTEKDYARLAGPTDWPLDLLVLGVEISFGGLEERFSSFIQKQIGKKRSMLL